MGRTLFALTATILFTLGLSHPAEASWFINPKMFHASVHGQMSCQDCHENILQQQHPDPKDIVKKKMAFFKPDECLMCHEDVTENLEKGLHGGVKVERPETYSKCVYCHDPHTQDAIKEVKVRPSPSKPLYEQCGACHEEKTALPPLSEEDKACMECHRAVSAGDEVRLRAICFHCHAQEDTLVQKITGEMVPLIRPDDYESGSHADVGCTECHPQAVRFNHSEQEPAACTQCHVRHNEKVTHDSHSLVTCGACHLGGITPVRDVTSKQIVWKIADPPGGPSRVHDMVTQGGEKTCKRCHFDGNAVGAAAMILPAKSVICMPCHAATFSVGDTTTVVCLLIFLGGMVLMFGYVLTGSRSEGKETGSPGSSSKERPASILKAVFFDVLLQKRLYLQSKKRWIIHGLIFFPFVFRLSWGLAALIGSLWDPQASWVWVMLDKNKALTGLLFDLTGMMVIVGVVLALIRGAERRQTQPADSPKQDRVALLLIGAIVVAGFVLEGMRIAMTGYPPGSPWSFAGYVIGIFCAGLSLTGTYGYVWYVHAVLTGAFIAYIPFSRLAHIIIAPLVLALNATGKH